jgi:SAM-dependent methyltransferase
MNTTELAELAKLKQGARATWAAGDFPAIAERQLWEVGPRIVDAVGVRPGEDVLDVACGTGNAALRAAQAGATAVGLDITPELFDTGRRLAAELGVTVDWVQGDAEDLPFEDESYDAVVSTFGSMLGAFFRTVGPYLPPPSPLAQPPALWGSEDHVTRLFEGTGIDLEFDHGVATPPPFDSTDDAIEFITTKFGPMIMAKQLTETSGRWPELRAQLAELYERDEPLEYLVTVGRKEER